VSGAQVGNRADFRRSKITRPEKSEMVVLTCKEDSCRSTIKSEGKPTMRAALSIRHGYAKIEE
jgi:hypothetical protein